VKEETAKRNIEQRMDFGVARRHVNETGVRKPFQRRRP